MTSTTYPNGLMSPPHAEKMSSITSAPRTVLAGKTGRILCVADIRGDYHELNRLIREHEATAVIHTGDFGFINADSLERMSDKILRHLLQYSPLIPPATRNQLLSIPSSVGRAALVSALNNSSIHFPLSQFPHLISGAITFPVPVFTVWGLIEDVRVLEKFRTGEYEVHNLSILDEAASRLIEVSGLRLRLFGLGGAVAAQRMFDNGEGYATIAGGQGTMWTTALQIGELVETAQRVYDSSETRLFVSSAPISRNGILSHLSNALKADLTISGGLHFRYPISFNEFAVHGNFQAYRDKFIQAREEFASMYSTVKERLDASMNEYQQAVLKKAIGITQVIPQAEADGKPDGTWTNTWHWVLSDAACGHLLFSVTDGRVSAETKSTGLNFSHRVTQGLTPPSAPLPPNALPARVDPRPSVQDLTPAPKPPPPDAPRAAPMASTSSIPLKPPPATDSPAMNKGPTPRQSQPITKQSASIASGTGAANTGPAQSSIPAKPSTQPRAPRGGSFSAPRGGSFMTGQALAASGANKDLRSMPDSQAPARSPAPLTGKAGAAFTNGKPSPTLGSAKIGDVDENKAVDAVGMNAVPTVNGAFSNGDKVDSRHDEAGDKGPDRDVATEEKTSTITNVKIIMDHISKKQKDFAYVDFDDEEGMQEALKSHTGSIRETTVTVSVSNPPPRSSFGDSFRGRGRGGFRGRGGPRGSFAGMGKKDGGDGGERKEAGPNQAGFLSGGDK
ncbi:MAG: hypothetical protein TREMPRED_000956 [Tremellales sp. Tagirdzhanova-0007]|nr:MAG: hypothetical protein TREMPRED_000956 [Tremellales sp. Tagirdzhanova-0007]